MIMEVPSPEEPAKGHVEKPKRSFRSYDCKNHLEGNGPLWKLLENVFETTITEVSVAQQKLLSHLQSSLHIVKADRDTERSKAGDLLLVDLVVPCWNRDEARALENIEKSIKLPSRPPKTPRENAEPRYQNSYRLISSSRENDVLMLRFRLAERYFYEGKNGKISNSLTRIDAMLLQGLIRSWIRPDLGRVPELLRGGVCQKAAEQINSFIGLLAGEEQEANSFPSLLERDPQLRLEQFHRGIEAIVQNYTGFEYKRARDIAGANYAPDDRRGNRLVNVDSGWIDFTTSPFPGRFPATFVESNKVIVWKRRWTTQVRQEIEWNDAAIEFFRYERTLYDMYTRQFGVRLGGRSLQKWKKTETKRGKKVVTKTVTHERLYASIPLFNDVPSGSSLERLSQDERLFWWKNHQNEFTPLPTFAGAALPRGSTAVMVPLEYDPDHRGNKKSRFEEAFSNPVRTVCWATLIEREALHKGKHGEKENLNVHQKEWALVFATAKEVKKELRPHVLGVHFQMSPAISWTLMDRDGNVCQRGEIRTNIVLNHALVEKDKLEKAQRKHRWVGKRRFHKALATDTYLVIAQIAKLAQEMDANLAIEEITTVNKQGGSAAENSKYSLWNYAMLGNKIEWKSLEDYNVQTICRVNDYKTRFTCPKCRACRKAGQALEVADTWVKGTILHCRKCGFEGESPASFQADLVAEEGVKKLTKNK